MRVHMYLASILSWTLSFLIRMYVRLILSQGIVRSCIDFISILWPLAGAKGDMKSTAQTRGGVAAVVQGLEGLQQDLHRAGLGTPVLGSAGSRGPRRAARPAARPQESIHGAAGQGRSKVGGERAGRRRGRPGAGWQGAAARASLS